MGRIIKAHGTRGEFVLRSYSGETAHLLALKEFEVRSAGRPMRYDVAAVRRSHKRLLVKLKGIDSRDQVRALLGGEVWVPRRHGAPLRNQEYYVADLVGCALLDAAAPEESNEIGVVRGVIEAPADDYLEVELTGPDEQGGSVLIPFRDGYLGVVDTTRRRIYLLDREVLA